MFNLMPVHKTFFFVIARFERFYCPFPFLFLGPFSLSGCRKKLDVNYEKSLETAVEFKKSAVSRPSKNYFPHEHKKVEWHLKYSVVMQRSYLRLLAHWLKIERGSR